MKVLYVVAPGGMSPKEIYIHPEVVKLAKTHTIEVITAEQAHEMAVMQGRRLGMNKSFNISKEFTKIEISKMIKEYETPIIKKNDHPFGKFIGNHKSKRGKKNH